MKTSEVLQLEKELGITLKLLEKGGILDYENKNCYLLDNNNRNVLFFCSTKFN